MSENKYLVKLVRDKMEDVVGHDVDICFQMITDRPAFIKTLKAKLVEEVFEYIQDPNSEEMADIIAVLEALARYELDVSWINIIDAADRKNAKRGGFMSAIGMYLYSESEKS